MAMAKAQRPREDIRDTVDVLAGGDTMIATLWFAYVFIYKGPRP